MKNEIFVHTEKGQYVGGEVIRGVVYVNCVTMVPAKSLKLKLKGMEKTSWEEQESRTRSDNTTEWVTVYRGDHRDFFKNEFILFNFGGVFAPGTYAYPFQWPIPTGLPGSFHDQGHGYECYIHYQVKAILDIPGTKHDLKFKMPLTIIDRLDTNVQPQHYKKQGTVRFLCCIPKGDLECEAWMDKNAYCAGETAQIHVNVKNDSTMNVDNFAVKLMRVVTLNDKSGRSKRIVSTMCKEKYPGTPALTSKESDVPLPLVSNGKVIQQSVKSTLITCACEYFAKSPNCSTSGTHHVDIECQVPWAPDIEIHAPVEIYEPANPLWAQWQLPAWSSHCVVQRVDNLAIEAAVATTLLASAAFGLAVTMS